MQARVTRAGLGAVVALLAFFSARAGLAVEPQLYRWSWVRLPGAELCPSAGRIAASVRERLGRDPFLDAAANDIEGTVTHTGDVWQAQLSVLGAGGKVLGSRQLQASGADCSTLADAVVLAVALTIDPQAAFAPPGEAPAAPAPVAAPPAPPPSAAPPSAPPSPAPAPLPAPSLAPPSQRDGALGFRGLLVLGVLPGAAFGAESSAELALGSRVRLSGGVSLLPETRTADGGYAFGLSAAALGVGVNVVSGARARLLLCAEGQLGAMHAVVYAVDALPPGDHLWLGARLGPRLSVRLGGPLWLELGALPVFPLTRHRFTLRGQNAPVFQSGALGLAASAGLSVSIP